MIWITRKYVPGLIPSVSPKRFFSVIELQFAIGAALLQRVNGENIQAKVSVSFVNIKKSLPNMSINVAYIRCHTIDFL